MHSNEILKLETLIGVNISVTYANVGFIIRFNYKGNMHKLSELSYLYNVIDTCGTYAMLF